MNNNVTMEIWNETQAWIFDEHFSMRFIDDGIPRSSTFDCFWECQIIINPNKQSISLSLISGPLFQLSLEFLSNYWILSSFSKVSRIGSKKFLC